MTLDNADARLNPLGLARDALSFDISPSEIDDGMTHFEQVFDRAVGVLSNAVFAFDNAKRSTEFLRQQENSVAGQRAAIEEQEQAFENELIEIYGTPYPDDIGPGKTYAQGYEGPDLLHAQLIDEVELFFKPGDEVTEIELPLDPQFVETNSSMLDYDADADGEIDVDADGVPVQPTVTFSLNSSGEFIKPPEWTGRRSSPGRIQTAISDRLSARIELKGAADSYAAVLSCMKDLLRVYLTQVDARTKSVSLTEDVQRESNGLQSGILAANLIAKASEIARDLTGDGGDAVAEALPLSAGVSSDVTSAARAAAKTVGTVAATILGITEVIALSTAEGLQLVIDVLQRELEIDLEEQAWTAENRQLIRDLQVELAGFRDKRVAFDVALRRFDQAQRDLTALIAEGFTVQRTRETFRKRAAAIIQGFRTRDLAFRVFRNEALEKYKTLFDLASRYTFLAARAYDYETGLLDSSGSSAAAAFFDGIVRSRALGVVDSDGNPQFTASTTGDPGLAGVLAQMQGDWAVAKTRLGFNNPDRYRTLFSLREENYRIIPGEEGDQTWRDRLAASRMDNVLDDPDVRRYALQIADDEGLPVPGLVISFDTTIVQGFNFFGQPLAGGDHGFSPTSFATKIRASGIAFDGYIGMDSPTSSGGILEDIGAQSPGDPDEGFLDPQALSATPFIYLIPTGVDSMRSPPLGDTSTVRNWAVDDQAIPLPFNIGNTDFSTSSGFISSDSLSEEPFAIRKHQAFRAVPSGTVFSSAPGFTNSRLIGRSVWNSQWKIIIPGSTLRNNPDVGLQIFMDTVRDIELFFETYSYSGN